MSSSRYKAALLLAASFCATAPACAQSAFGGDAGSTGGDIIVTAQRRAESQQDVPISISQFSQNQLTELSIDDATDLQFVSAGLSFQQESGASQIVLRGVGTGYSGPGLEGSVALYLDGAYLSQQIGAADEMLDVKQIQVLKGPQGALYGRNATGGAILIDTNDPSTDKVSGHVKAGYGNLDAFESEAVVNLPFSDTAAIRLAGAYRRRDGYVRTVSAGRAINPYDAYTLRGKILWAPSDDFSAVLKVEYSDRDYGNTLRKEIASGLTCLYCNTPGAIGSGGFYQTNQNTTAENMAVIPAGSGYLQGNGNLISKVLTGNLRIQYDIGKISIKSTTGYRRVLQHVLNDSDATPQTILMSIYANDGGDYRAFNEDLQISSDLGGAFDFIAGGQYQKDNNRFPLGVAGSSLGGLVPITDSRDKATAISIFAEIYFRFLEKATLTVGGRYTHDRRLHFFANNADAALAFQEASGRSQVQNDSFTPRVVLAYNTGAANFYASYNKGIKAGGFNSPGFNTTKPVRPETIEAYEIGAKFVLFDRHLRFSLAAFHYDWKNLQVGFIDAGSGGITQQNAAAAKNDGVEASIDWNVTGGLSLKANVLYQNARFTSFPNAAVFIPAYLLTPGALGQVNGSEDIRGFKTPNAPKFAGNVSLSYGFDLGASGWTTDLSTNVAYKSSYDMAPGAGGPARLARDDGYALMTARVAFNSPGDRTVIEFWADNITRAKYYNNIVATTFGAYAEAALPRTYGVSITQRF
ncbi:MAG: TonB-dependent receptor [Novosphingobium sp.]|jgi:iron complex outermembrane receptor protein|nr:TonB-dependent receptor [Novosphingobium sp.]